jgi:pilus assembly protein CpaF
MIFNRNAKTDARGPGSSNGSAANGAAADALYATAARQPGYDETYVLLRDRVQERLLTEYNPTSAQTNAADVRRAVERIYQETLLDTGLPLSRSERGEMFEQIVADILGLGPLEQFLRDESVTEILVNGPRQVFVERGGILERTDVRFADNSDVMRVIERIVAPIGRRVDESSPMVDARLPDGSRVNVIIPPLSLKGPCISIRKFARTAMSVPDLVRMGTLTPEMADFLRLCVAGKLNVVVSGGTSTGKTTVLNILSSFIPDRDRIITVEDAAELQLQQEHVVRLESRPPNAEGKGQVGIRQLVINALRMRPDRIVVGEVRGGEALDMLQAMNTGHEGSLTTVHSNSARDTLHRVETMVLMAGMDLPLRAIREQIASAFDVVVHLERMADGTRRIVQIAEVQGMEGEVIVMQDVFKYQQQGFQNGKVLGQFKPTGVRPKFVERLESRGYSVPPTLFAPRR